MSEYQAFKESLREGFNKRFDKRSQMLRRAMTSDEYNLTRLQCFEWYLSGLFDGLLDTTNGEGFESLEDIDNGRTKPFSEIRKNLKGYIN
jgi:hypothetical protein